MSDAASQPLPLDTLAEYRAQVLDRVALATARLDVFDHDLGEIGLESSSAIQALEQLCQRGVMPEAVRLLIRDPRFVEKSCPRLMLLLQRFAHRMELRLVRSSLPSHDQPFVIADDEAYVMRFHHDSPRGKSDTRDAAQCAHLRAHFETMWLSAQPGPSGTALGL